MKKKNNFRKKHPWRRALVLWAVVVTLALFTFIGAKYRTSFKSEEGQMTSEQFYFTTDLLGDETMAAKNGGQPGQYQYADVQEGAWHLYGGGTHELSIQLRNYYDELRVTKTPISYRASITVLDKDNKPMQGLEGLATLEIEGNSEAAQQTAEASERAEESLYAVAGELEAAGAADGKAEETLTLHIKSHEEGKYEEGTVVEVTIESTAPYQKTMKLRFSLYKVESYLSCEIRDKENSPYAEVILMTNVIKEGSGEKGIQPYLQWSEELSIDNTNSMTFTYDGSGKFMQVRGMEDRKIQISGVLAAGESRSIYFFKKDTGENYSRAREIVEQNTATREYVVQIGINE